MRYLLVALLFVAPFAGAQTALRWNETGLAWIAPTTCTDGSPIADCPVTGYRVETATSCTATTWELLASTPATPTTYKATALAAGSHCFRVKARSAGGDSAASNTAVRVNTPPLPGAPSSLTAVDTLAYEIIENSDGSLVASLIGVLPQGSLCSSETREVNGQSYRRVDPKRVDLVSVPELPVAAWALCAPVDG